MKNYVLPETIAKRFDISTEELMRSRKRGLRPGKLGFTIPTDGGRKLVFPADLHPTIAENREAAAEKVEAVATAARERDEKGSESAAGGSEAPEDED